MFRQFTINTRVLGNPKTRFHGDYAMLFIIGGHVTKQLNPMDEKE